ncbi:unnamed protein product [Clonostachys chloroleuca]|uniref:Uncharacterized protein n=1 Tax=Clonostachys chloroleuca TaxID=1926264 RepID=A0AA35Q7Q9_9HYPO|nr:unnamed protein product [Clonostachys chloroleuca]
MCPAPTSDSSILVAMGTNEEEGDGHDEEQPFLPTDNPKHPAELRPRWQKLIPSKLSLSRTIIFVILTVATVLGLGVVALGLRPGKVHGKDDHGSSNVEQDHAPQLVQYKEELPVIPRLRDGSEYLLNPAWASGAPPTTREYFWTIVDAELNPDGIYRPMMLINNQFPGPLVECNEGDRIIVHIENRAVNATSIHFHGLFQNGTNTMDGTVGITQCAIAPNSSFTYTFDIKGQSGTYWYHAHQSAQASDGLLGPVVIHAADERIVQEVSYDTDRIIMIQDHYHNTTAELLMEYLKPDMENDEPVPDNALINGRGRRKCEDFPGSRCDDSYPQIPFLDLEQGKRHRVRFINVGAFAEFQIQFDEHPFYITEVDGVDVHPEPFHRLNIMPAQRYSVILETNVTSTELYWMRARMVTHCFTTENHRLEPEIRATMRYSSPGAQLSEGEPTSKDWPEVIEVVCRDLNTSLLHPVQNMTPPVADDFLALRANFMIGAWRLARGFFNGSTWHANTTYPSLHRFLDSEANVTSTESSLITNEINFERENEYVIQTTGIRTVDISINNFDDGSHPFHLHGHRFFILFQGTSGYPPTSEHMPALLEENKALLENPLRRDTITVEGYAWAVIRVVLDNPGMWAFHCHNTWHAESGMLMQFMVRSEIVKEWEVDPKQRELCHRKGVETGQRPPDSIWFGSF